MPRHLFLKLGGSLLLFVLLALAGLHLVVLPLTDSRLNRVLDPGPYPVAAEVAEFHERLFVADLHSDALLWGRDLEQRNRRGQVDLPRLSAGGVDLQVFSAVTQMPRADDDGRYRAESDQLPLLFFASARPPRAWFSPRSRALAQAEELSRLARDAELILVQRRADLDRSGLKALLALEGMQALDGDPAALDELYTAGYRMMGLTHFFDNAVAGSSFGSERYGLTEFGRQLVPRMEKLGITIDLAHASPKAFDDLLAIATRPVVVSHGGVNATCPGPRNLTDAQLRAVAANGGVVGIGYWPAAVCGKDLRAIVKAIRHAIDIAGVEHVGLGSDFDGAVATPFDTSALPQLTAALLAGGLSSESVARVMGGNLRRLLSANLPP